MTKTKSLENSPLGKDTVYLTQYQRDLLFSIPRQINRDGIGIQSALPFRGQDIWNVF